MKNKISYLLSMVLLIGLLIPAKVQSFNKEREGFILGFGVGAGSIAIKRITRYNTEYHYKGAFYTDFKIGHGVSKKVMIYYTGKQWFGFDNSGWYLGYPAVGISIFKKEKAPSIVFNAAVGMTLGLGIEEVGVGSADGAGSGINLNLGLGYEWRQNVFWEINLSTSQNGFSNLISEIKDHDSWQISISLNLLKY